MRDHARGRVVISCVHIDGRWAGVTLETADVGYNATELSETWLEQG